MARPPTRPSRTPASAARPPSDQGGGRSTASGGVEREMDGTDRRDPRDHRAPLYDARFEHDACGVGFVADAGGRSGGRVLPLALAGLAALAHRGAFAADGESSDGAGVALPLSPSLRSLIAGPLGAERPAVVMLFLPRGRSAARAARDLVERTFADADLPIVAWRSVPLQPDALGTVASTSRPLVVQAIVARPDGASDQSFERRLVVARRRLEAAARTAGGAVGELSVPSASCRHGRVQGTGRRHAAGRAVPGSPLGARCPVRGLPPALRHEHDAGLAARPAVPGDRPQRRDQHGARQPRAGARSRA